MLLRRFALAAAGTAALAGAGFTATTSALASPHGNQTFIGGLHHTRLISSTVPSNGDVNPLRRRRGQAQSGQAA
jgi:hypothetical protein